jgi:hypothetical protein
MNIAFEDPELFQWMQNTTRMGVGSFISYLVNAGFHADGENAKILYPVLKQIQEKYPEYSGV